MPEPSRIQPVSLLTLCRCGFCGAVVAAGVHQDSGLAGCEWPKEAA
jgi:hypothetical protein